MQQYNYTVVIEPDEYGFHAFAPALKGCHTFGMTVAEARLNIVEAIEVYLESLIEEGDEIPVETAPMGLLQGDRLNRDSQDF